MFKVLAAWRKRTKQPQVPRPRLDVTRSFDVIYAIGDVHGHFDALVQLEELIQRDRQQFEAKSAIIMLGDYVDRGPKSFEVVRHLMQVPPEGMERLCLCGNHEDMLLRFVDDPMANASWLSHGARSTLASYGNIDMAYLRRVLKERRGEARRIVSEIFPQDHLEFLRQLPVLITADSTVFAHAGIRPGVPIDAQTDHDLMWIREPFLSQGPRLPLQVIHGHSPTHSISSIHGRIGIDTAAYATGQLTALRLSPLGVHHLSVTVMP